MMTVPATVGAQTLQTVGISELRISRRPEDVLATYSLGSCVGLALYDPAAQVAGLIHCMLPQSSIDPRKAEQSPAMFVDTGVPALLQGMFDQGATRRTLVAKVAGGANVCDDKGLFRIGDRNCTMLRKILWKNEILLAAEDVGGAKARTLYLHVATGRLVLKAVGEAVDL